MATLLVTSLWNENIHDLELMHLIEMKANNASEIARDSSADTATYERANKLLLFTVQFMQRTQFHGNTDPSNLTD